MSPETLASAYDPTESTYLVLEKIKSAWYEGRPIVPIIGAGFSADSGFPILSSICRYLARFKYALDHNLLLPQFRQEIAPSLHNNINGVIKKSLESSPIHYIKRFGWPDRFDLNQRVARHVTSTAAR